MGPIRIVRQLMAFAILCLAAFVALSISTDAASEVSENLSDSVGAVAYLLTAAGLGAAFAALMKIGEYVTNVNYDEKYDFTYWQLIVLGLIAGVVLATLIPADVLGNAELATPLLALLGGFSATAVHKILNRLTDTLVTIVQGDKSQEAAIESKAASEKAASDALRIRLDVGARAMAIRNELNADVSVDRVANDLDSLFADYLAPYKDSLNGQN